MGKSSLLVRLALGAIGLGGLVLFDPVGDTARTLLARLPVSDRPRVLWISPTDSPAAIDLLAALREGGPGSAASDRSIGDLVDALRRVRAARYADTPFWGPRIEESLRSALTVAAAAPSASLTDAERLLSLEPRRAMRLPTEVQPAAEALAERVASRPEEVDGARRLLGELTHRPVLRTMLDARGARLRAGDLLAPRTIAVISGEAARIGESAARYLLAVHLALLWSQRVRQVDPGKTFVLLDEAQWYVHESAAEMLRLGRRTNLHLILATQSLASLPESVREAVQTNAADLIAFRGSPDEARAWARISGSVRPEVLWGLPRGTALALIGKGEQLRFLSAPAPAAVSAEQEHRALDDAANASRRHWMDAEELSGRPEAPTAPGPGTERDERERPVLLALWAGLLDSPEAPTLGVRLGPLRREADPAGERVRAAGRRLHELGLLASTGRDPLGPYWIVRRAGFDRALGGAVDPRELAAAELVWRRILAQDGVLP